GESFAEGGGTPVLAAFKIYGDSDAAPVWTSTGTTGTPMGPNCFGGIAVRCTSTPYTSIADSSGHIYRLAGTDPMMAGQWPTDQCGNRRAGKSITYPTAIAELPPFFGNLGNSVYSQVSRVDVLGRSVGQAYGNYDYSCGQSD